MSMNRIHDVLHDNTDGEFNNVYDDDEVSETDSGSESGNDSASDSDSGTGTDETSGSDGMLDRDYAERYSDDDNYGVDYGTNGQRRAARQTTPTATATPTPRPTTAADAADDDGLINGTDLEHDDDNNDNDNSGGEAVIVPEYRVISGVRDLDGHPLRAGRFTHGSGHGNVNGSARSIALGDNEDDSEDDTLRYRELGRLAVWSVTSCKPGNGVQLLRDSNIETYWQSDGAQPHLVNVQFQRKVKLCELALYTDFRKDESYTPSKITIRAGNCIEDLKDIKTIDLHEPQGWVVVPLMNMKVIRQSTLTRGQKMRHVRNNSPIVNDNNNNLRRARGQLDEMVEDGEDDNDVHVRDEDERIDRNEWTRRNSRTVEDASYRHRTDDADTAPQRIANDSEQQQNLSVQDEQEEQDQEQNQQILEASISKRSRAYNDILNPIDAAPVHYPVPLRCHMIQLAVIANHQNGRDTHLRQIKIYGPRQYVANIATDDVDYGCASI